MVSIKTTLLSLLPFLTSPVLVGAFSTPGTTSALRPELAGTVIADVLRPFSFHIPTPPGSNIGTIIVNGTLQDRVVRRDDKKTLDIYYRIMYSPSSTVPIVAVTRGELFDPVVSSKDVDWRVDGLGVVAPVSADYSWAAGRVVTRYAATARIQPGQESRFVFVATNSTGNTGYTDDGAVYLDVVTAAGGVEQFVVKGCFMPVS